jgi:hypothetical protein
MNHVTGRNQAISQDFPRCWWQLAINNDDAGRITIELRTDIVRDLAGTELHARKHLHAHAGCPCAVLQAPITCENFRRGASFCHFMRPAFNVGIHLCAAPC